MANAFTKPLILKPENEKYISKTFSKRKTKDRKLSIGELFPVNQYKESTAILYL